MNPIRIVKLAFLAIAFIVLMSLSGGLFENVDATEIAVIQSAVRGTLTCYTSQGWKPQMMGKVTLYPKRAQYEFETQVRFNDGGHGVMKGSVQYQMPLDCASLTTLHTQFGSAEAINKQLIEKVVNKSVYMTGPLMSSKESYAEKRNYLINYVEDQIAHGVYRTVQRDIKVNDPLTGQEKSAVVVEIQMTNAVPQRQEEAILTRYGIVTSNFAINGLVYDDTVEKQIQQQQQITMQVQTAIAESRQAEQKTITVEQQGRALAAEAKWAQEVVKAKQVTAAESSLAVQVLANQEAEQYRQATLKRADADAGYRRQVMQADGALKQKLEAVVEINKNYAIAIKDHAGPWVPSVVMGSGGAGTNGASLLIDLLSAKAAKDVAIDLSTGK